jgi:ribonuclease BN (tRNA processing enzyme)
MDAATESRRVNLTAAGFRSRLVLIGTAGGSSYYPNQWRRGVASAVVVGETVYLVDCGEGVGLGYRQAGLGPAAFGHGLDNLRAIFFTHLHSDHTVGYPGLLVAGFLNGLRNRTDPIKVYGPGRRGSTEVLFRDLPNGVLVTPENSMPGTVDLTRGIQAAYAADLNERALRYARPVNPESSFEVHDIELPPGTDDDPSGDPAPQMEPFVVYEDANVRASATLVDHRPCFPTFGFRFETPDGVVVFSGDSRPNDNLIRLARDADILVHEVVSRQAMERMLPEPAARARLDAIVGYHTMVEEVGRIASAASVKTLVLSPVLPPNATDEDFRAAGLGFAGLVILGQDLDQIGVGSIEG